MKKLIITACLLIIFLFFGADAYAQKYTTIIYKYNQDSLKEDSFYFQIWKNLENYAFGESLSYPGKLVSFNKKKDYSETIVNYLIRDTTCAFIADGYGHETFVIPGDTMIMNINKAHKINNHWVFPWFHDLAYEGKNQFVYSLFDSLAFAGGEYRLRKLHYNKDSLNALCKEATHQYEKRKLFLELYCARHNVGKQFKELADNEIYSVYIKDLLTPLSNNKSLTINKYSEPYRMTILKKRFNDPSIYFKTVMYSDAAYACAVSFLPISGIKMDKEDRDIKFIYEVIKVNYSDSIRDHLLTRHLSGYLSNKNLFSPCYDSLITDFKSICKNYKYTHNLDSLLSVRKALGVKKYSFEEAMSSQIVDTKDQLLNVKKLFKSKPLLIICWASWCAPCLKEIPSEKKLQDLYWNKIDFVYLSLDRSKKPWRDKLQELTIKDSNNYLLTNYFNSDFAHFYEIGSIPFYLLYDRNGNKVDVKDLRPSDDGFKSLLDKLLY